MESKASIQRMRQKLIDYHRDNKYVIFLCGPDMEEDKASSRLRKRLLSELEERDFEVVLGEDAGLEELRTLYGEGPADHHELRFIKSETSAIVLIADSVGSFCELGLFGYQHSVRKLNDADFILLINSEYQSANSYLNNGPSSGVEITGGKVIYCDFDNFDESDLMKRLEGSRAIWASNADI